MRLAVNVGKVVMCLRPGNTQSAGRIKNEQLCKLGVKSMQPSVHRPYQVNSKGWGSWNTLP